MSYFGLSVEAAAVYEGTWEGCDHADCPAEARWDVIVKSGTVLLCGHHMAEARTALEDQGAILLDRFELMVAVTSPQEITL